MPETEAPNPNPAPVPGGKGGDRNRPRRRGRRGGRGRRRPEGVAPPGPNDAPEHSEEDAPDTDLEAGDETTTDIGVKDSGPAPGTSEGTFETADPATAKSLDPKKSEQQRREHLHREPSRREPPRREPPRREPFPPPFQPAPVAAIHQALDDVMQIVGALKQAQDKMEEVLELVELAERQKLADEREIDQLRRTLRQVQNRSRDERD